MFDGLLKSKFYSKCKTAIKLTKTRTEMIKRKRNAMQKYLRNDIADLLTNGLDIHAYDRAEGLLVELNKSTCYDFIEQFCGCVSDHLSLMNKQRECPDECKEAVSSLMFAAARFADMPELRELRSIFADRYANTIEANINHEFVEKLKAMPPTKDMKLQLLQDIALESGLQWDSKALEQKLYHPPASEQTQSKNTSDDRYDMHRRKEEPVKKTDKQASDIKQQNVRDSAPKGNKEDLPSYGRKELGNYQQKSSIPESNVAEEETDEKKPFHHRFIPPPPYTKPKASETERANLEVPSAGVVEDSHHRDDDSVGEEEANKPKPRSVRRRPLKKPPPDHHATRQDAAKKGHEIVNEDSQDQDDDEDRAMDRLLVHYCRKKSPYDMDKAKGDLKPHPSHQPPRAAADISHDNANIKNRTRSDIPARAASLPPDPTSPVDKKVKGHVRASSYEPDGHVHPKMPDYDDFVARLAALKGE